MLYLCGVTNKLYIMKTTKLILLFAVFCIAAAACKKEELQIDKDKKVISDYLKEHNIEAQQTEKLFYVENVVGTGQHCKLGDNVAIKVDLIYPVALNEGLRFAIREGGRTVGSGQVTKIL